MRIKQLACDPAARRQVREDLETLLRQPSDKQARPCPDCRIPCPKCGATNCTCACSPHCPQAPRQLSSDPEAFPIEAGIVPLVYGLSSLRLCPPCWSCEGHLDRSGALHKLPRVWFYCRSVVYPSVIAEYLSNLLVARKIRVPWQVNMVHWGEQLESTFSIEPALDPAKPHLLEQLQQDVRVIAADFHQDIRLLTNSRMRKLATAQ